MWKEGERGGWGSRGQRGERLYQNQEGRSIKENGGRRVEGGAIRKEKAVVEVKVLRWV